ncbi:MAG: SpoIIE family protein phosphatase [bacterium]|nr:SpoIIE family protein phosphatase [bacterium]
MKRVVVSPSSSFPTRGSSKTGRLILNNMESIRWAASALLRASFAMLAVGAFAGQEPIDFGHISLEQGLSQSIVEQMVQDRTGFMWFATEDGLNRFDGYRFTVYKNVPGDSQSLSYNQIKAVYEDREGVLWIGIFASGLNRFDPSTEKVVRYRHDQNDPDSLGADSVLCVLEDTSGRLWVGTQDGGLDRFDRETGRFVHHRADPNVSGTISHDDVRSIFEDRDGVLWIGTNGGGLNRLDPESGVFTVYRHSADDPRSLSSNNVFAIHEDRAGTLWIGTYGGGLDVLDRATNRFTHYSSDPDSPTALSSSLVKSLCEDHEGTLWVGTDGGGLNRFDRDSRTFTSYRHDPVNTYSLSTDRVFSVFQDRSHVLWVGTYGGGLSFFDVSRKKFHRYRNDPNDENSLSHDIVWSFHEDRDGILWVGTDSGGLNRFDRRTGTWRRYLHRPDDPASLSHNTVRVVFGDRDGRLWVGTHGGGLDQFHRETGRFTHHRHDPNDPDSLSHDQLRSIFQDRSGSIWVGTYSGGLDRFDPETGVFTHFSHDPDNSTSLSHDFIRFVFEDSEDVLWVGTQGGGLNRLDPDSSRFVRYRHDPRDSTSIATDHVFAAYEDHDGVMWFGTFGGGLNRLDRATGRFRRYRQQDGLAGDSVYAMLGDEQDVLWISSTQGLSRFDPSTESFRDFDVRDGLQSNEFNGGSAYRSTSGEMFFGGINGFNTFFPSEIDINSEVPNVVITDIQLFNQSVGIGEKVNGRVLLDRPVTFADHIELSHRDNVITFEFAALHYSSPGKNLYAYRMEGFSDDWAWVSADRRFATFTGLRPGDYVFSVRGSNSDGVWNEEVASLTLTVKPPFWATWWFRLIGSAALAGIAAAVVQSRLRGVRMKAELMAAHDAQMAILPQAAPEVSGVDIAGAWIPASDFGGDFYDYFWLEGEPQRLCVVVADVAGKGMRAAMNAVMSDGMVFLRARQVGSVEEIMGSLNRSLFHKVGSRMFTALCLVVIDPENRKLTFSNAGLCEPLQRSNGKVGYLTSPGARFPLGVIQDAEYESTSVRLAEGDVIVLFTDGVPEARNRERKLLGYDAPRDLLARIDADDLTADDIVRILVEDVERFCDGAEQSDDMAIVVIKA